MSLTLNSNPIVVGNTIIVKIKSQNLKILREVSHNVMNDARGSVLLVRSKFDPNQNWGTKPITDFISWYKLELPL